PFNPAEAPAADIGLNKDFPFPYPREISRPLALPLQIGFEGTLSPFYLYKWTDGPEAKYLSDENVHSGKGALCVDQDVMVVRYRHPQPISGAVSVWLFDDPRKAQAHCSAAIRDNHQRQLAVGVD